MRTKLHINLLSSQNLHLDAVFTVTYMNTWTQRLESLVKDAIGALGLEGLVLIKIINQYESGTPGFSDEVKENRGDTSTHLEQVRLM